MNLLRLCALAGLFGVMAMHVHAKDSIVVGLEQEPPHLDPTSAPAGSIDQILYSNVLEGLTRFGQDGSIKPGLAESWAISESGTEYVFQLRPGVTFHDGTEFDAKDVKFSLDRARDNNSQNAKKELFDGIVEVEVLGPLEVKVTLAEPEGEFLFNLAWGDAVIVAPESISDIRQNPIGTGAFRFKDWLQGERIELERYPEYWGEPAQLERAVFQFIDDPVQAFVAVMSETINAFPAFPVPEDIPRFEADPRFQVLVGSTEGETILGINNKQEPFDDVRVRRAVAHAIDRNAIINGAMNGLGIPIGTHFPPHHPDYVDLTENSTYDPALSIQLLAEAGFEDGFATTLKLPPPPYARQSGEIVAAQLQAIGINAQIINLEWSEWLEQVFSGKDFGLTIVSHPEPLDIEIYAQPDNYFQYDSVKFQAVMTTLGVEHDPKERSRWLAAAQRVISEDYANAFLFQIGTATVADAKLRGLWTDAPMQATDLTGVYWEE